MDPIGLLFILVIVGVVLAFVPMDGTIKNIIIGIIVILLVVWLFQAAGAFSYGSGNHWRFSR